MCYDSLSVSYTGEKFSYWELISLHVQLLVWHPQQTNTDEAHRHEGVSKHFLLHPSDPWFMFLLCVRVGWFLLHFMEITCQSHSVGGTLTAVTWLRLFVDETQVGHSTARAIAAQTNNSVLLAFKNRKLKCIFCVSNVPPGPYSETSLSYFLTFILWTCKAEMNNHCGGFLTDFMVLSFLVDNRKWFGLCSPMS